MNRTITRLIHHLEKFVRGEDLSVQWAKDAEAILDECGELDDVLVDLQEHLESYRPEGGRTHTIELRWIDVAGTFSRSSKRELFRETPQS